MQQTAAWVTAVALAAAGAVRPAAGAANVIVQQIEAEDGNAYAPVDYGGATTVTPTTGLFAGITFHADPTWPTTGTLSGHAYDVGQLFYGSAQSPAYPFVSDVYTSAADNFLNDTVGAQQNVGVAAAPGTFAPGASVVNNSYVGDATYDDKNNDFPTANVNAQRRIDFMIANSGVTFVVAAATGQDSSNGAANLDPLVWSSFNSLAVRGSQQFDPTSSPGKKHADLSPVDLNTPASFSTAQVSGYAAGLVGRASDAGQSAATRDTVVRSLLMAGTDKVHYADQTLNHLSVAYGAGQADYDTSLAILEGGQRSLAGVSGGAASATPRAGQQGWAAGTVAAGGQSVVLFSPAQTVTGVTASLNWDVTSTQPSAGMIDTTDAGVIFPNLSLAVCPVAASSGGTYVLGSPISDASLTSAATGDNVQYLYSSSTLAGGQTYAFLITGDPGGNSALVGFSYTLRGTFESAYAAGGSGSWDVPSHWTNDIPNGPGAVATFGANPAAVVSLDGDRRVGQLVLTSSNGYTITAGTGGTLTIDDSGDSSGTAAPAIQVTAGSHAITAPVSLANGVAVTVAGGSTLTLAGPVGGTGPLTKGDAGTLVLAGAGTYSGATTVSAGRLVVSGSLAATGTVTVTAGGTLSGTGTVAGPVNLLGTVTPGDATGTAVGTLTTGVQMWLAGSSYTAKIDASASTPRADELVMSDLSSDSSGLTVNPTVLPTGSLAPGRYTFVIADATTDATAFDALLKSGAITIGTPAAGTVDGLSTVGDGGSGEDLVLDVAVAPEPASLLLAGVVTAPWVVRRRLRSPV